MSQPWSPVHLNILLYLAWQKTGHYREIEQAWRQYWAPPVLMNALIEIVAMAPDTKKSLRAITDRLLSIPKDVEKIGLQKYFENGPPRTHRKSTASSKGNSLVKSKLDIRSTIQAPLPLPATDSTNENSALPKTVSKLDGDPHLSTDDDGPTIARAKARTEVLPSAPKENGIDKQPLGGSLHKAAKRPFHKDLFEDESEDDDSIQGPSKRHKSRKYVTGEGPPARCRQD